MKLNPRKVKEACWGYLFIAPLVVGLALFLLYPLISAIVFSFCNYNLFTSPELIGWGNYAQAFSDEVFWKSFVNILYYLVSVPISIFLSLILAALMSGDLKGSSAYRIIFYIPMVCSSIAVTFIWKWIYAPYYGLLDSLFASLGLTAPLWLDNVRFIPSMIVIAVWGGIGGNVLLYTPTMRNVSRSQYEAATLDGANWWQTFFHITFPAISPITFYLLITSSVGTLQEFTRFRVMSGGVFSESTIVPVWYIYMYTGEYGYQFGYASALGLLYGIILIAFVVLNFIAQKWWVKYDY